MNGYRIIAKVSDDFQSIRKGDIAVMNPPENGGKAGHIQAWDGSNWVSGFVQRAFWPGPAYRREEPDYEIYRRL
ncbi:hypothetical protein [Massilia sp. DWR3-1-1]|uniref:hypothetical protein n=1 Tax=Massilia sp. DWR3-1-1 TaxID=2804559 RepID=UPI003CEA2EA5